MTSGTPRQKREGWPWPALVPRSTTHFDALAEAQALVNVAAVSVADLTEALRLAVQRLEEAQAEARVAAACVATREAEEAILRARRRDA